MSQPLIICLDEDTIEIMWDYTADPNKVGKSLRTVANGKLYKSIKESMISEMNQDPQNRIQYFKAVMSSIKETAKDMPLVRASQVL